MMPTVEELKQIFSYDKENGVLLWLRPTNKKTPIGTKCGSLDSKGYLQVKVFGHCILVHRIIWAMETGSIPSGPIDHIDDNSANNKFCNFRAATIAQNSRNRKTNRNNSLQRKGVRKTKEGKYQARIKIDGRAIHLGVFQAIDDASLAYAQASKNLHGEFGRIS